MHATVVNARFVKPLDRDRLLPLMLRIGRVITVEENVLAGGFGSAVLEMLQDGTREVPELKVLRIGIGDQFVEHGSPAELRARYGLDAQSIAQRALESLEQPLMVTLQRSGMAR